MVTSLLLAAVCETVTVQNCPWATETLMSGLLVVAVYVWLELVLPLPSRASWYPRRAGTVMFEIGASEAVNNCRPSRTSTKGWCPECFEPGRDPAPCRSERELTFQIRSNIPVSSPEAPAELTACQERSRPHPVLPLYRTFRSVRLKQFWRRYGRA